MCRSTHQQVLSKVFVFLFLDSCAKVKKELLPCLRSFTSGLRVAEVPLGFFHIRGLSSHIFRWCGTWGCWSSPTLQKPPLSRTSKILGLCWRLRMDRKGELDVNKKVFASHQHSAKVWRLPSRLDEGHWWPSQRERATPSWDWWLRTPGIPSLLQSIKLVFLLMKVGTSSFLIGWMSERWKFQAG